MSDKNLKDRMKLFDEWNFTSRNYWIFGAGLATIIIGYLVMAAGEVYSFMSLTLAPILLFIGYIVLIPLSLIYRDRQSKNKEQSS